jgi:hypothetical protein
MEERQAGSAYMAVSGSARGTRVLVHIRFNGVAAGVEFRRLVEKESGAGSSAGSS